jgi:hypothetical protein
MANVYYNTVVGALLLFPWSLVGLMIVGALWERRKVRARARVQR